MHPGTNVIAASSLLALTIAVSATSVSSSGTKHGPTFAQIAAQPPAGRIASLRERLLHPYSDVGENTFVQYWDYAVGKTPPPATPFAVDDALLPPLRRLIDHADPAVRRAAADMLLQIGERADMELLLAKAPGFLDDNAEWIARKLVRPSTERQWELLERCATGRDMEAKYRAIQALSLSREPRARDILRRARESVSDSDSWQIDRALQKWPVPWRAVVATSPSDGAAELSGFAAAGSLLRVAQPEFDASGDRARVPLLTCVDGREVLAHSANTFAAKGDGTCASSAAKTATYCLGFPAGNG